MAAGADSVETAVRSGMPQTLWSGTASLAGECAGRRGSQLADRGLSELVGQGRAHARADPGDRGRTARRSEHGVPAGRTGWRERARRGLPAPLPPERLDRRRRLLARGPLRARRRPRHRAGPGARDGRHRAGRGTRLPPHGARRERAEHRRRSPSTSSSASRPSRSRPAARSSSPASSDAGSILSGGPC